MSLSSIASLSSSALTAQQQVQQTPSLLRHRHHGQIENNNQSFESLLTTAGNTGNSGSGSSGSVGSGLLSSAISGAASTTPQGALLNMLL